jgi:hypothetical protein
MNLNLISLCSIITIYILTLASKYVFLDILTFRMNNKMIADIFENIFMINF